MTAESLFTLLATLHSGVYAMAIDQTIVFWNRGAERILGYRSHEVLGRRCYEVVTGLATGGFTPECVDGCPSIRYLRAGLVPAPARLHMLCSSGERKWVSVIVMAVSGIVRDTPLLVHVFDEFSETESDQLLGISVRDALTAGRVDILSDHPDDLPDIEQARALTPRELEVLGLVAIGWETPRIGEQLGISANTVRKHISNLRQKLNAATKLEAVVVGMRLGILPRN